MNQHLTSFRSKEDAIDWMVAWIDDPYTDNIRFAFCDDPTAMEEYDEAKRNGCCGFFDKDIFVDGREAVIGCNYGH